MNRRWLSFLAVVWIGVPALCAAAEIPDFTPDQMGGTLHRCFNAEPQNLNPLTGKDLYERFVNEYVFEYLLERDLDTMELKGVLAERWEMSDDGRVITFHLKPEARFSDGHPLTADDVIFSYEAVKNPKIDCRSIASYLEDCERCEKVDDHTVRFVWKKTYFKTLESSGNLFPILPKHIYERNVAADPEDKAGKVKPFNDLAQGFIGSGPYKFERWKTGQEIVLVRNKDYWGKPVRLRPHRHPHHPGGTGLRPGVPVGRPRRPGHYARVVGQVGETSAA